MKISSVLPMLCTAGLILGSTLRGWSQDTPPPEDKPKGFALAVELGPDDVFLPITSIEWGIPDRWSFTARYIHMFDKDRDNKPFLNNLTVSLSPGTDGGRLGIGWQGIYSLKKLTIFWNLSQCCKETPFYFFTRRRSWVSKRLLDY